jgi:predicted nucleic acid-binding protein
MRSDPRNGEGAPRAIVADAERLFETVANRHVGATSCLTYNEVEEALYRQLAQSTKGISHADSLLIPAARSITTQVQMIIELFGIAVLDLTAGTVRLQLQQLDLQTRGIRAADALHAATAMAFNADLLVTTDDAILNLDGVLVNGTGRSILCRDTDQAIALL